MILEFHNRLFIVIGFLIFRLDRRMENLRFVSNSKIRKKAFAVFVQVISYKIRC